MSALANIYGSAQRAAPTGVAQSIPSFSFVNPAQQIGQQSLGKLSAAVPSTPNVPVEKLTPNLSGPQQMAPGSQGAPSMAQAQQASAAGLTPQQAALIRVTQQQLAAQAAARQAAYNASVPGQVQGMINSRGVFAGGQQAAAPAQRPNTQLPAMAPPRGVTNYGGA